MRAGVGTVLLNELFRSGEQTARSILVHALTGTETAISVRSANRVHQQHEVPRLISANEARSDWQKTRLFLAGMIESVPGGSFFGQNGVGLLLADATAWLGLADEQSRLLQLALIRPARRMEIATISLPGSVLLGERDACSLLGLPQVRSRLARDLEASLRGTHQAGLVRWLTCPFLPM